MGHVNPKKFVEPSKYQHLPVAERKVTLSRSEPKFVTACEAAGVKPTPRQYSKWCRRRGLAAGMSKAGRRIDKNGTEI